MERIVLRHLSGSKANQVEEFPLNHFQELTIGRDPASTVKYDPDRDDLVGRSHARIMQDPLDPTQFTIADLNSRNGTFVNRQRIVGSAKIVPGDVVQFGPGGPEFQFDVEPRPAGAVKTTRIAADTNAGSFGSTVPATRVGAQGLPMTAPGPAGATHAPVGKATVERMVAQSKSDSRKFLVIGAVAIVFLILAVAGVLAVLHFVSKSQSQSEIGQIKQTIAATAASAPMSPADIVKNYTNSVVYVEVGWKLIYTPTGGQVYHTFIPNRYRDTDGMDRPLVPNGPAAVPAYVMVSQDTYEPLLTLDNNGHPIGGEHTGSGFVVTSDGFILTNRHVAATWRTTYHFPQDAAVGVIIQGGKVFFNQNGQPFLVRAPNNWAPSETRQAGQRLQGGFDGRNDYLNVTFAKNELRIPAKLVRASDRHDAAMIKIDIPEAVTKVELNDNYDSIKPGDAAIVLGYPSVSPPVYGLVKSQDVFNRQEQVKIIPDPTVSVGNIGRVIRGQENAGGAKDETLSVFGDAYQLTINSTGAGNSGGPVFDDRGHVTGIFFAGVNLDASITFAVPIRFGKELMGITPISK